MYQVYSYFQSEPEAKSTDEFETLDEARAAVHDLLETVDSGEEYYISIISPEGCTVVEING